MLIIISYLNDGTFRSIEINLVTELIRNPRRNVGIALLKFSPLSIVFLFVFLSFSMDDDAVAFDK